MLWLSLMPYLKSFMRSWPRAFGEYKPDAKRAWTAEFHYARQCQPTRSSSNNKSCHEKANEKNDSHDSLLWLPAFCLRRATKWRWHHTAPQTAGQVISQCWQNGTWQPATNIFVRFVTCSGFYCSGDTPDHTARSQVVNGVKGIGRKIFVTWWFCLYISKVRAWSRM